MRIEPVYDELGTEIVQIGAAAGKRAGQVINHTDLDRLVLGPGGCRDCHCRGSYQQPAEKAGKYFPEHSNLPG
jgi:hypothetical protein